MNNERATKRMGMIHENERRKSENDNIGVDPTAIGRVDPPMKDIV